MSGRRRRDASVLTSPVLVGALTVLVVIVAVGLAYNANNGLPFVPTYNLHVQVRNADQLQKGDDVNEGGALIGTVASITPARVRGGQPIAMLNLHLDKSAEPLPRNTRFTIRLKGAIGLKYLNVTRGSDAQGLRDNATVPIGQTGASVDFDQVLDMFTPRTRTGVQDTTLGFGEALAGRGAELNSTIGQLGPLLSTLEPVARNLASQKTDLVGFLRGLTRFTTALAPAARAQADLFANLNTTFRALAPAAPSFARAIADTPPAFSATIDQSPRIRTFLGSFATLLRTLEPGFRTIRTSAPVLVSTFRIGARTLPPTSAVDTRLVSLAAQLHHNSQSGEVTGGLDRLALTANALKRPVQFLAPVQTTCNYATLFLSNISSLLSEHVTNGTFFRFVQIAITDLPGDESGPSHTLYKGKVQGSSGPVHSDPYPNTASPGEVHECSAGNEPFLKHVVTGNPPYNVGTTTLKTTRSTR